VKTPPSVATSQYPPPDGDGAMATIGSFNRIDPAEPKNPASPNVNTPPSRATSQ
jgi:hypothetical protein